MYYANKIVGWAMSPMGLLFLGIVVGIGLRRLRGLRGLGNWAIGLTLVLFWMLGCGVTTRIVGVPLEGDEEMVEVEDLKLKSGRVDAIVLLGGGMGTHEKCGRAEMFAGADRVWHAARMWRACCAQVRAEGGAGQRMLPITLSGGGVKKSTVPLLEDLGVPREAMMFFETARNTEEEARMICNRLRSARGDHASNEQKLRVLLVTSAWHMPRAKRLFERVGFEVVAAPTDYEMHYAAEQPLRVKDFFPGADALMRNSAAVKEWVARIGYALLRR